MRVKNYKQAEELIKRYRSITLEEIKVFWNVAEYRNMHNTANELTGYGDIHTCTLCKACKANCNACLYNDKTYKSSCAECTHGKSYITYFAIFEAKSSEDLLLAFKNRADYIVRVLNKKRKKQIV